MTTLAELSARARQLLVPQRLKILGVTGPPGAGKSTLATALVDSLRKTSGKDEAQWVAYMPLDGFHLADVELERLNLRDHKGAPDTFDVAGYVHALKRMRSIHNEIVYVPSFERSLEQPIAAAIPVPATTKLVVTEGNYLLYNSEQWRHVHEQLDEVWYVESDSAQRLERLITRHVEFGKTHVQAREWVLNNDESNARLIASTRWKADLVLTLEDLYKTSSGTVE